ncbi:TlpA family protein disulfide reductase [Candidatus Pacebacteria bacterium]|nr:TlpA family protein disulfide reductase [Candidatus Paceibacterota bacterium]
MTFKRSEILTLAAIVAIVAAAFLYAFIQSDTASDQNSEATRVLGGTESPFTDLQGNPFPLEEHKDKVRVVNAWASWCPFCVNELPDFITLSQEFKDVAVIAINRKESNVLAQSFVAQFESLGNVVFVQDPEDSFYKSIGGFAMPETVFYDQEGNVSFHKRGFMTLEEMRSHTQTAISATNTN